jgi:hypothetical protein
VGEREGGGKVGEAKGEREIERVCGETLAGEVRERVIYIYQRCDDRSEMNKLFISKESFSF